MAETLIAWRTGSLAALGPRFLLPLDILEDLVARPFTRQHDSLISTRVAMAS